MNQNSGLTDGTTIGNLVPLPVPKMRLATVKEVRLELARLYRSAKAGDIDVGTASRLAFILDRVRQCIVDHELEDRVEVLEQLKKP